MLAPMASPNCTFLTKEDRTFGYKQKMQNIPHTNCMQGLFYSPVFFTELKIPSFNIVIPSIKNTQDRLSFVSIQSGTVVILTQGRVYSDTLLITKKVNS
jgi:hypothetical protein